MHRNCKILACTACGLEPHHFEFFTQVILAMPAWIAFPACHLRLYGNLLAYPEGCHVLSKLDNLPGNLMPLRNRIFRKWMLSMVDMDIRSAYTYALYLHKDYRGQGLASQAASFLEEMCRKRGWKKIWLTCNKNNENTLAVYRHLGFENVRSEVTDIGNGFVMDDYILELTVD